MRSRLQPFALAAFLGSISWTTVARADNPLPPAAAPAPDAATSAPASQLPDVAVTTPQPPSDAELAGDSLFQFIVHHATVHYVNTGTTGSLARWRGGRPETICPLTLGLTPGYNAFVTARIRALAVNVGAPLQTDPSCKDNVRVLFTTEPEIVMTKVLKWAGDSLGVKYPHETDKLLEHSATHAIQGWYVTAGGGNILNKDVGMLGPLNLLPLWPLVIPTGLNGDRSASGGIVTAIFVINTKQVAGQSIGTIADYVGTLALSVVQSPDHCDPMPSILDLMSSTCGTRAKPVAITAGDLAFLKALYYHNTGLGPSLSRDDIQFNMLHQFKGS